MLRRWVVPIILVAVAATMSACSPPRLHATAVFADGDDVVALIHQCGDKPISGITLRDVTWRYRSGSATPSATASPDPGDYWYASRASTERVDVEVALLRPSAGWEPSENSDLTEFLAGRTYEALSSHFLDDGVEFTLADVAGLSPGQVWYRGAATTRDDYLRRAEENCRDL